MGRQRRAQDRALRSRRPSRSTRREVAARRVGGAFADTKIGKSMAAAAERSELQTRELAMKMESRDAAHLEESRWRNELNRRQAANPDHLRERGARRSSSRARAKRSATSRSRTSSTRSASATRRNDSSSCGPIGSSAATTSSTTTRRTGITGVGERDEMMAGVHNTRERRYALEAEFKPQETERRSCSRKRRRRRRSRSA